MRNIISSVIIAGVLCVAGMGCQNSVVKERDALVDQNRQLQSQLDDANRRAEVTPPPTAVVVAPTPVPTPIPAASVTPASIVDVAPAPDPAPIAAHKPDFGGLEVTHDIDAGTTTVNLPSDVFFTSGQAILLPDAKKSLSKVAGVLKKEYAAKTIRIEGHTDSDPIKHSHWKSNQELSEKRAEAVKDYLVSKGLDADKVSIEGFGDTHPKSKSDKAKNRRVELVVVTK